MQVTATAATGVGAELLGRAVEDTITLTVQWENLESGNHAIAVYTASWASPPADVHSQQRFFAMCHKGEVTVDQAHRGYTTATDAAGFASLNPLFWKPTPSNGKFVGQGGYGYRSIESFVEAVHAVRAGKSKPADFDGSLATLGEGSVAAARRQRPVFALGLWPAAGCNFGPGCEFPRQRRPQGLRFRRPLFWRPAGIPSTTRAARTASCTPGRAPRRTLPRLALSGSSPRFECNLPAPSAPAGRLGGTPLTSRAVANALHCVRLLLGKCLTTGPAERKHPPSRQQAQPPRLPRPGAAEWSMSDLLLAARAAARDPPRRGAGGVNGGARAHGLRAARSLARHDHESRSGSEERHKSSERGITVGPPRRSLCSLRGEAPSRGARGIRTTLRNGTRKNAKDPEAARPPGLGCRPRGPGPL